jgi:segregation and condensation protein A
MMTDDILNSGVATGDDDAIDSNKNAAYRFKLNEFEGPLDLLIFLIKKNEVNLYDIPIAEITNQYLNFLQYSEELDLDALSDFHLMASTLLLIKSRMLLPIEFSDDEEIEDPREELVEKLIEYQRYKKLSLLMEETLDNVEWDFEAQREQRNLPFPEESFLRKIDVWDLVKEFARLISKISDERILDFSKEFSINEKITLINELLEKEGECSFSQLIVKHTSTMEIICAFLAILEAVKLKIIEIYQHLIYSDIVIKKANGSVAVDDASGGSAIVDDVGVAVTEEVMN